MAAQHGDFVGNNGGCVEVRFRGAAQGFRGSERNGIKAVDFDSWFPATMEFRSAKGLNYCSFGNWWLILLSSIALTFGFSLLKPSRALFFWAWLTLLFWYSALAPAMEAVSMTDFMTFFGRFVYFLCMTYVFVWNVGGGALFATDTSIGAPFDALFLDVLPSLVGPHFNLLAFVVGDYDLTLSTFTKWQGVLLYMVIGVSVAPAVAFLLRAWYKAGMLRWLACVCCGSSGVVLVLTILFALRGFGLHLHHYFVGLVGYMLSRGHSRVAAICRALCLGLFLDGIAGWGDPSGIPIWSKGSGWSPDIGGTASAAFSSELSNESLLWTSATSSDDGESISLTWASKGELLESECMLPMVLNASQDNIYVLELNHVELYRGPARSVTVTFPTDASVFYFRVGAVNRGVRQGVKTKTSVVLPVLRGASQPVAHYYGYNVTNMSIDDACTRAVILQDQPAQMYAGYI
eukprot:TRINITY_DN14482_c0_g1_i4.p1 TRINITY_DN14482_c0_g1~~TRINITY_DN14482_c0_g1_i4.p1  ORF type:complete len:507 (-),score=63.36 TRINITY_DN14482_c0_g1_i4:275-1657(-)